MIRSLSALAAAILLFSVPGAEVRAAQQDVHLRNGVDCHEQKVDAFEGETHRCFFSPKRFGERDFSTRNGRALYVFSTLGDDCKEIEILGDGPAEGAETDEADLRQVSVSCID